MKMDIFSEASNRSKILTYRHINLEKPMPKMSIAINTTELCHSYTIQPDFGTYLEALQSYAWALWSVELLVLLVTYVLYIFTLRSALRHWRQCSVNVGVVLAVYPVCCLNCYGCVSDVGELNLRGGDPSGDLIPTLGYFGTVACTMITGGTDIGKHSNSIFMLVSTAAFLAVILPRARLLAEAIAQEVVMIAMYHLYCLVVAECGGADQFVRTSAGARLETRVVPCCCWPCCVIPRPILQKRHLTWLRYLVLQMPVVQGILYTLILILSTEDMRLYLACFTYLQPFIAASILSGMWGVVMTVRAAATAGHNIRARFFAVQLVLVIVKLQCGLAKVIPEIAHLRCILPLNPSVFTNLIQNCVVMIEMLFLSIWALFLYRTPPGKDLGKTRQVSVAVMEDSCSRTSEIKAAKEGVENQSYKI